MRRARLTRPIQAVDNSEHLFGMPPHFYVATVLPYNEPELLLFFTNADLVEADHVTRDKAKPRLKASQFREFLEPKKPLGPPAILVDRK